jgi:hypothetical protein
MIDFTSLISIPCQFSIFMEKFRLVRIPSELALPVASPSYISIIEI